MAIPGLNSQRHLLPVWFDRKRPPDASSCVKQSSLQFRQTNEQLMAHDLAVVDNVQKLNEALTKEAEVD
jgi:hypothetical protein